MCEKNLLSNCARSCIAVAMIAACAALTTPAIAGPFSYKVRIPGTLDAPLGQTQGQAPQSLENITVALSGGPALPNAEVSWPYRYDLKQLLAVTGDSAYNASSVAWTLSAGSLPAGLSLGPDGVISGTPQTKNLTGSTFQVDATYKSKAGQQAYTIVVGGVTLHVTQVSAGATHTCAVTTTGAAKCWGANESGQLGNNSTTPSPVPVSVFGLGADVASISSGGSHSCALTKTGGVKCWGSNGFGRLGNNSTAQSTVPVDVSGLASGATQVVAGGSFSCALSSGAAYCWGFNAFGQLGNNGTTSSMVPTGVYGLSSGVIQLTAGSLHACALTSAGGAYCWGYNDSGQLGNNTTTNSKVPVAVNGLTAGVAQVAASNSFTCAVTAAGGAKCWGLNSSSRLGNNSIANSAIPVDVYGLTSGVTRLATGSNSSCALTSAGGVKCWGLNSLGQLGNSSTLASMVPVDVYGLTSGFVAVTVGSDHSCAVASSGSLKCWGYNANGQLGNNTTTSSTRPVDVSP